MTITSASSRPCSLAAPGGTSSQGRGRPLWHCWMKMRMRLNRTSSSHWALFWATTRSACASRGTGRYARWKGPVSSLWFVCYPTWWFCSRFGSDLWSISDKRLWKSRLAFHSALCFSAFLWWHSYCQFVCHLATLENNLSSFGWSITFWSKIFTWTIYAFLTK